MKYTEFTLNVPEDKIDARCEELEALGITGLVIESEQDFRNFLEENRKYWDYVDEELEAGFRGLSRIKFYIPEEEDAGFVTEHFPDILSRSVSDEDWENNWRQYYKPIEIGERLVVIPQWEDYPENGRVRLVLDPGLIFGTGSHSTTGMCLEALQEIRLENRKIIDLGCGSGILGIGAMLLGAESCTAVDIDEKAPDVVYSNAALNGVKIDAYSGDVLGRVWSDYDICIANIVADVIIQLAPNVKIPQFICSGIIDGRESEVESALADAGFIIVSHKHRDEWNAYVCHRTDVSRGFIYEAPSLMGTKKGSVKFDFEPVSIASEQSRTTDEYLNWQKEHM